MVEVAAEEAADHLEEVNGSLLLGKNIDLQVEDLTVVVQVGEAVTYKAVAATMETQEKVEPLLRSVVVVEEAAEVVTLTLVLAAEAEVRALLVK